MRLGVCLMRIWKTNNVSDYLKVSAETEGRTIGNISDLEPVASPNNGHYSGDSEEDECFLRRFYFLKGVL